jgi:succinylglutamic semialdehyde dehydrogenase
VTLVSTSPANPRDELGRFHVADAAAVDEAVSRARAAFPAWRDTGPAARASVLQRFRNLAARAANDLAPRIAREVGKALWDARSEAALLAPKVDVTLAEGMGFVTPIDAGPGAQARFQPRGVLAVLGPFNFPVHLPNGHIAPALATGNSVVFKPSELAPSAGQWMTDLWHEAGLPEGVLQIVHGGAETGRALAAAPVDGILFTGSWGAGRALREATLDHPEKLLALEMGGKNAVVVLDDADLELAVSETALSICATTGQRCSCASRIFVERGIFDAFAERLAGVLAGIRIGPPLEPGAFMGPLVSETAHAKVLRYRALAGDAGGQRIDVPQPQLPAPYLGPGLVRFADARQDHAYHREEIFGPEAGLYPVDGLEQAIAAVNDSDFGLVASVMTANRAAFEHCVGRVRTGLLNWNRATVGASGKLPFGGRGRSGNDRPAGVTATLYCATPQALLEGSGRFDPSALPPGMPRP